ncbi:hypothetical protein KCU95_g2015, partial [Aureobasidium melanogenum]
MSTKKRPAAEAPVKKTYGNTPTLVPDIKSLDPEIMGPIAAHLIQKYEDGSISFARQFRGGWEVWLQIELATVLLIKLARQVNITTNGYTVERETAVWKTSGKGKGPGKCDLWIQPNLNHNGKPTGQLACVMELKVDYSYLTGESYKTGAREGQYREKVEMVRDRFIKDLRKVKGGLNDEAKSKVKASGINMICLALTSHPQDLEGWKDIQTELKSEVKYIWLKERDVNEKRSGLAMIWWEGQEMPTGDLQKKFKAKM